MEIGKIPHEKPMIESGVYWQSDRDGPEAVGVA